MPFFVSRGRGFVLKMNEKALIWIGPFGMDMIFSIYYLAAPLILIELKANPVELGLVGTIASLIHMGMAHATGRLSDRFGRRRLLITAPLLFAVSCLVMASAQEIKFILALSVVNGLCMTFYWPPFQAWVADQQTGSGLARNIGDFNMSWTAATLMGPILSGVLYSLYPRLPFFTAAAFALSLFFLIFTCVRDKKPPAVEGPKQIEEKRDGSQFDFLYATWVANFASWFVIGNARYQFPKLARELNIPPQWIGLLVGCIGFAMFSGFFILRRSERWHFNKRLLLGVQFLAMAAALLISWASSPGLFALAFILLGTSASVTYYSSLYYAVHLLKAKGKGTGLHESILGSGAVLGPILGGIAAQYTGLRAPYLLCFGVLLLAMGVQWTLLVFRGHHRI
jgi:MFS transporter, DHA1 family, multidrug resistance protein